MRRPGRTRSFERRHRGSQTQRPPMHRVLAAISERIVSHEVGDLAARRQPGDQRGWKVELGDSHRSPHRRGSLGRIELWTGSCSRPTW